MPRIDFSNYLYYHWDLYWSEKNCFDKTIIWCPPPELGRQLITFLINIYGLSDLVQHRLWSSFLGRALYPTGASQKTSITKPPSIQLQLHGTLVLFFLFRLNFFTFLLTFLPCLHPIGESHLPIPMLTNIEKKLTRCAGWLQLLFKRTKDGILFYCFRTLGFNGFILCGTAYHTSYITVGAHIWSQRRNQDGLSFPPVKTWPRFIWKTCTVRSVTKQELLPSDGDLLLLERIKMIDVAWNWARGTYRTYQT